MQKPFNLPAALLLSLALFFGLSLPSTAETQVPYWASIVQQETAAYSWPSCELVSAIILVESRGIATARNGLSVGLMQVNGGSVEPRKNVLQGVKLLRKYYHLTGEGEAAVKAYNVGIGTFLRGGLQSFQKAYWSKVTEALPRAENLCSE